MIRLRSTFPGGEFEGKLSAIVLIVDYDTSKWPKWLTLRSPKVPKDLDPNDMLNDFLDQCFPSLVGEFSKSRTGARVAPAIYTSWQRGLDNVNQERNRILSQHQGCVRITTPHYSKDTVSGRVSQGVIEFLIEPVTSVPKPDLDIYSDTVRRLMENLRVL